MNASVVAPYVLQAYDARARVNHTDDSAPLLSQVASMVTEIRDASMNVQDALAAAKAKAEEIASMYSTLESELASLQGDVDAALPAVREAEASLDCITPGDITVVRGLANPPAVVKQIMDAVLIVLRQPMQSSGRTGTPKGDNWHNAKRMMSDLGFLNDMKVRDTHTASCTPISTFSFTSPLQKHPNTPTCSMTCVFTTLIINASDV